MNSTESQFLLPLLIKKKKIRNRDRMDTEKTKYVEILFDDVKHVNSIASESVVRSLMTFRQQEVFSGGMVILWKGRRVHLDGDDRLLNLKKHYERLTMSIAQDFLLYGFSILLAPSVLKKKTDDVQVTSHVDMQAVIVRIQPRTTSGLFSASNLDYLVLDRVKLLPLKNCIVLEHPLWKPHSSGTLHSPVGSLLSWWRQQQKELTRADMVAETLSRVNIFYEDMPELYKLVDQEDTDKSTQQSRTYSAQEYVRGGFLHRPEVKGQIDGALTRSLDNENNITRKKTAGIITLLGNLDKGEAVKLHELRQREAVYGGLLAENMEPMHKHILHEHVIPVNTYRAPRGTRIQRIQMPCDVKAQNRSSSSSSSGSVKRGDVMNSAFLDIKERTEKVFSEKAMSALEVGRGELGAWLFTGKRGFVRTILQDAIASVMKSDTVVWQDFEEVLREQEQERAQVTVEVDLKVQQKTEGDIEQEGEDSGKEEEKLNNEAGTDPEQDEGNDAIPAQLSEEQAEEAEKTVRELTGISTSEWSLVFYELIVEKQRAIIKDIYVRDEAYRHGRVTLEEEGTSKNTNNSKKRSGGPSDKHKNKVPSNTIVDPNDPNYVIVGPYRRRIK